MRIFILIAAAALALAACAPTKEPFHATDLSGTPLGGPLALADHAGKARTLADFKGKVVILFFGYTQCPDVCPTNMAAMARVMELLGAQDAARVQVLFVTVDPERDTAELLAQYVPSFNPSFLGLVGTPAQIDAIAKEFRIFFKKQPGATPTTYTVDHSAGSYVYDPKGALRLYLKHGDAPDKIAADVRRLLAGE